MAFFSLSTYFVYLQKIITLDISLNLSSNPIGSSIVVYYHHFVFYRKLIVAERPIIRLPEY